MRQFASPLIYVLLAAMVLSLAIGHWEDAIVISAVAVGIIAVGELHKLLRRPAQ